MHLPAWKWRGYFPLIAICSIGLAARLAFSIAFPSVIHPDETIQYLEQANRALTGRGLAPWEFEIGARSWVLPGLLMPAMATARWISPSPDFQLQAVAFFNSLVSLFVVISSYALGWRALGPAGAIGAALLTAIWPEIVLMSPHALADTFSAIPLIGALAIGYRRPPSNGVMATAGALLGFAVMLRPQLIPAASVAAIWMIGRDWKFYSPMLGAGAFVVGLFGMVDWMTWGRPFSSIIRYIVVNGSGVAESFGVSPFYQYLVFEAKIWFVALPLIGLTAALGARRLPLLAVVAAIIVLTFSAVAHKEERFIYPALPLVFTLCGVGTVEVWRLLRARTRLSGRYVSLGLVAIWTGAATASAAQPAFHWRMGANSGALRPITAINADHSMCGVAVYPTDKWCDVGLVRLRPDLNLFELPSTGGQSLAQLPFNAIIAFRRDAVTAGYERRGFKVRICFDGPYPVCLLERATRCAAGTPLAAPPSNGVVSALKRVGLTLAPPRPNVPKLSN